jgi:hypothetical protein
MAGSLTRIHRLPLLLLATLACLLTTLPHIFTLAIHYTAVTPDNSVLLANALGHPQNFNAAITEPICFIKIHSVQDLALDDGIGLIYSVQGCVTHEFRGFGVCTSGECAVKTYQVQVFLHGGDRMPTVQNIWAME